MNLAAFDKFCKGLPSTNMVVQWGDSHVHKIGGKLFAMANEQGDETAFILKATPLSYQILLEQNIATRAPYLTTGNWLRIAGRNALPEADLIDYIKQSYQIIADNLPKTIRAKLGIPAVEKAQTLK